MTASRQHRRQAKEQRRRRRQHAFARGSKPDAARSGYEVPLDELVVAVAEAVAAAKPGADALVTELSARPAVVAALNALIGSCWAQVRSHGWEPEVAQHAVRRLGSEHGAWLRDGGGHDVRTGVELLGWLMYLPPLPAAPAERLDVGSSRMLERVRGLLSKAESTEFADEADALTAKAQELISRHSLHHLLDEQARRERPVARHVLLDDPYADAKALLASAVAAANRCRAVHLRSHGLVTVIGFDADLYATQVLFSSLLVQATRSMAASGTAPARRQPRYRRSFLVAFASRIGERLEAVAAHAVDDAADDRLLPVLAARRTDVDEAFDDAFPHSVERNVSVNSWQGWASGRAAADLADLAAFDQVR